MWARVKLHPDCHVQFEKTYYCAAFPLVRQRLWLRATETTVQRFRDHELVATHRMGTERCRASSEFGRAHRWTPSSGEEFRLPIDL